MSEVIEKKKLDLSWVKWVLMLAVAIFLFSIVFKKCDGNSNVESEAKIDSLTASYKKDVDKYKKREVETDKIIAVLLENSNENDSLARAKDDELKQVRTKLDILLAKKGVVVNGKPKEDTACDTKIAEIKLQVQDERMEDSAVHELFAVAIKGRDSIITTQNTIITLRGQYIAKQDSSFNSMRNYTQELIDKTNKLARQKNWSDVKGKVAAGVAIVAIAAAITEGFIIKNK